jgi:hypothetical protein
MRIKEDIDMKKYIRPVLEILVFTEEEIVTISSIKGVSSEYQQTDDMFERKEVGTAIAVDVRKLKVDVIE